MDTESKITLDGNLVEDLLEKGYQAWTDLETSMGPDRIAEAMSGYLGDQCADMTFKRNWTTVEVDAHVRETMKRMGLPCSHAICDCLEQDTTPHVECLIAAIKTGYISHVRYVGMHVVRYDYDDLADLFGATVMGGPGYKRPASECAMDLNELRAYFGSRLSQIEEVWG